MRVSLETDKITNQDIFARQGATSLPSASRLNEVLRPARAFSTEVFSRKEKLHHNKNSLCVLGEYKLPKAGGRRKDKRAKNRVSQESGLVSRLCG